jgi:uncharacterized protein YndB with AHSA1/START domain
MIQHQKMSRAIGVAMFLSATMTGTSRAEVTDAATNGFTLRETAHIKASPDKVYAAITMPSLWWSSAHTFSGSARNLTLDARAGGCWCESLPNGGSVQHLTVVMAAPGKTLRLRGALGPFQTMAVDGAMVWTLAPGDGGTDLTLTYTLAGYVKDGFGEIAKGADGVLAEQVQRLTAYLETGSPQVGEKEEKS